jgi:copper(I)-binding protein
MRARPPRLHGPKDRALLPLPLTRLTAGVFIAILMGSPSLARDYDLGRLHISHPWVRPTPPGAPTAAGYLTIANHGASADRLLGGTSPQIGRIEVHEMSMTGQVMRMRPMADGLEIAAGQSVNLSPGGDRHLMLVGPKRPLKVGDKVPVALRFQKAGAVNVTFVVEADGRPGDAPMSRMEMH